MSKNNVPNKTFHPPIEQVLGGFGIPEHKSYEDKMDEVPLNKSRSNKRKKMSWNKHVFKPLNLFYKKNFPKAVIDLRNCFSDNPQMKQEYMEIWQVRMENPNKYNTLRMKFLKKHTGYVKSSTSLSV